MKNKLTIFTLTLFSLLIFPRALEKELNPGAVKVKLAEYSRSVSDEPYYNSQTHLQHINIGNTWETNRGEGVTVAVIDTGINYNHVDFRDENNNSIILDSSAYYYYEAAKNQVTYKTVTTWGMDAINDTDGHGTNVAGTIAAQINGVGTAGVSPNISLMIIKSDLNLNSIYHSIRHAADNGADIINMSFGAYAENFTDGNGKPQTGQSTTRTFLVDAINYAYNKGIVLIAAAGNDKTNKSFYPAANNNVLSVGALANNSSTTIAGYSNYGTNNVMMVAPGTVYVPAKDSSTSYKSNSGTSFASPIVSAAAAIYLAENPSATPSEVYSALQDSAVDLGTAGLDATFGNGRLSVSDLLDNGIEPDPVLVESLNITPAEVVLEVGESVTLTPHILPLNADNKGVDYLIDDEDVATVGETSGIVTGVSPGETYLYAFSDDGNAEQEIMVTVIDNRVPPTLSLNTTNFDASFPFNGELDVTTLSAIYSDEYGVESIIPGTNLTISNFNNKALGEQEIDVTYLGISQKLIVRGTNKDALRVIEGTGVVQSEKSINGSNWKIPLLTEKNTETFTGKYNNDFDVPFTIHSLRNLSGAIYYTGNTGYLYNEGPLTNLKAIRVTYPSASISTDAYISVRSGTSPVTLITSGTQIANKMIAGMGQSEEFTVPNGHSYFRITSTNNKNLQIATITLIFETENQVETELFSIEEQAQAFVNYFSQETREVCLTENVPLSLWNELAEEFNYLDHEVKLAVKDLMNSTFDDTNSLLLDRYMIIVNKYRFNDFLELTILRENSGEVSTLSTNLALLATSFVLFLFLPFYYLQTKKYKKI